MRPSSIDTLTALRRVLGDIVLPNVGDTYARIQLRHALAALEDLVAKIPDEMRWLMESLDGLDGLLADAGAIIAECPAGHALRAVLPRIHGALEKAADTKPIYPDAADLTARVDELRSALSDLVFALGRHGADLPELPALQARIRGYLRQNIARS
jgi:hypothetical protein